MPKLWNDTINTHRKAVSEAILDAAATAVAVQGLHAVTMSQIAQNAGIGRATLYKYFADVPAILFAWHERQIAHHLIELDKVRFAAPDAYSGLQAVLETYSRLSARGHHVGDLATMLHRRSSVQKGHAQLHALLLALIEGAVTEGQVRADTPPTELATYCLAAIGAAHDRHDPAANGRLVAVILAGLQRQT